MANTNGDFRILIIGAGSAGLLLAQGLKKIGISCKVFEQDASLGARARDWNFGLYWAQSRVQELLPQELYDRLVEVQIDSWTPGPEDVIPIYHGESGELLLASPAPFTLRLQRGKFRKLLATGIDIHYGKKVRHIETSNASATASFEDGSTETANLIIGAEGTRSPVRSILLGPEKGALKNSPLVASMCLPKFSAEAAEKLGEKHPRFSIAVLPGGIDTWIGAHNKYDDTKPGEGIYNILMSWLSDEDVETLQGPAILADMKERASRFADPWKQAMLSMPDDTVCWHTRLTYWPTEPWDNRKGTVTLAGDAAHPMTFHRGQGLNNAIDDAAQLIQQLRPIIKHLSSPSVVADAITRYDAEVQQRGRKAVLSSLENSLMLHDWDRLRESAVFKSGVEKDREA